MSTLVINRDRNFIDYKKWIPKEKFSEIIFISQVKRDFYGSKEYHYVEDFFSDEFNLVLYDVLERHDIELVFASNENDFELADSIRNFLKLKDSQSSVLYNYKNKILMKKLLLEAGVSIPQYHVVNNISELIELNRNLSLGCPYVLKPVNGSGSSGVNIIKDEKDFITYINQTLVYPILAESYVDKELYHADGIFYNGIIQFLVVSKYISFNNVGGLSMILDRELGSIIIDVDSPVYKLCTDTVTNIAKIDGAKLFPFHFEFFYEDSDKEIIACEIAARLGGPRISDTIYDITGVNLNNLWISHLFDLEPSESKSKTERPHGGWYICSPTKTLVNCQAVNVLPYLTSFDFRKRESENENKITSSSDYKYGFSFSSQSENHSLSLIKKLKEWIEIYSI